MNGKRLLVAVLSALSLSAAGMAVAAEQSSPAHGSEKQKEKGMDGQMSCGSMMGRMGGGMMGGGMMNNSQTIPNLPPGNEKLGVQMHAEMMQAMGTIMQKYADRVVAPQGK